jgi:predicted nucleic acid-binding protein
MIFLDTNILVYAYDNDGKIKHQTAKDIVINCWNDRSGSLSTQVFQEFYVTVTRKLPKKLSMYEARETIKEFLSWPIYHITPTDIISASELEERHGYSFWDSLVITAAKATGATILYSEDMQDGQQIDGLKIINPFK